MQYKIIYSSRKTLCLQITRDAELIVRAPLRCSKKLIEEFVAKNENWIENKLAAAKEKAQSIVSYTKSDIEKMRAEAKRIIPPRVEYFSKLLSLYPTSVKITSAKTRHGSCSGKNALCFSLYLMTQSSIFIDGVILHELAHIKHKNHSAAFYAFLDELKKKAGVP